VSATCLAPCSLRPEVQGLTTLICAQADVFALLELVPLADGRFAYLIETSFPLPRYVLGTTDGDNVDPRIVMTFGNRVIAQAAWDEMYGVSRTETEDY